MFKFYFLLWFFWTLKLSVKSVGLATFLSFIVTFFLYVKQGFVDLNSEVMEALGEIFVFWFPLAWSLSLLIVLFRSLKYVFNVCYSGYQLKLLECNKVDLIEVVGYGDLLKVWRKWFMLLIWLSGVQMIIAYILNYMFSSDSSVFNWFNIYVLFGFVLISGYFSFMLLGGRCKKVKVMKC